MNVVFCTSKPPLFLIVLADLVYLEIRIVQKRTMSKQSLVEKLPTCFRMQEGVELTEQPKNKLVNRNQDNRILNDSKSTIWTKTLRKSVLEKMHSNKSRR